MDDLKELHSFLPTAATGDDSPEKTTTGSGLGAVAPEVRSQQKSLMADLQELHSFLPTPAVSSDDLTGGGERETGGSGGHAPEGQGKGKGKVVPPPPPPGWEPGVTTHRTQQRSLMDDLKELHSFLPSSATGDDREAATGSGLGAVSPAVRAQQRSLMDDLKELHSFLPTAATGEESDALVAAVDRSSPAKLAAGEARGSSPMRVSAHCCLCRSLLFCRFRNSFFCPACRCFSTVLVVVFSVPDVG